MNYIQQGYTGKLGMWKYLLLSVFFFGFMGLNLLLTFLVDIDIEQIMKDQIAKKGSNRFLFENLIPFAIGLGGVFFWVKYVHNQRIRTLTTSRKKIDWKRIFFAFSLWGFITALFIFIDYQVSPKDYIIDFQLEPFLFLVLIAVLLIPLQTSFEEYLFRGYLMQGIGITVKNRWIPLIFTSVIFGLLHIANPEVEKLGYEILVYYIGTGFFLGILTLMDEGLELAIGFHAANNLITALLVTSSWTAFQTNSILIDVSTPTIGADVYVPVFIVFPILLFIFSKKYGWTNWKEKLTGKIEKPKDAKEPDFF
ncbi:MAG: CPBP family intramembrane metalloprotease [Flavobacteriia bacterium]|nr:CPBP family intramembrane metalloprotease [Flavobacteriia bacterium]OIP45101.1 MAG: CAAX protease family protein [Flavobacteriaceae bacterium CG2_30_31_66]PIV95297.1 MAG: CPBP family intramembrane metalloprotease domain-containing protein [Flavobacteriaceae bacterium CG17_big_fil_post_rev_8_21_14_2_50_31_13]PIX14805.1 MAG: CPBP family intramembrane metalloprotease domain-containing protein [Flavobacteriaceae bacterium CG_4_8_14_3_um_filter_31_8]PIY13628.1 MAG: CPBP family intramembrane metal